MTVGSYGVLNRDMPNAKHKKSAETHGPATDQVTRHVKQIPSLCATLGLLEPAHNLMHMMGLHMTYTSCRVWQLILARAQWLLCKAITVQGCYMTNDPAVKM